MRVQKRRRPARPQALAIASVAASLAAAIGCVLGPDEAPGCHADRDCRDGFTCRAGACLRTTTDASAPEPGDASPELGDAPVDG